MRPQSLLPLLLLVLAVFALPARAADLQTLRDTALAAVNASRQAHDLPPLETDETLAAAAQAHAEDMLARTYYSHVTPGGKTVLDRYLAAGGSRAKRVAENIARCTGCAPPVAPSRVESLQEGWMGSEGHRKNILDPGLTHFGFGLAASEDGGLYAVQNFAGPGTSSGAAIAPDARLEAAVAAVNRLRVERGVAAVAPAPAVSERLRDALPDSDLAGFDLQSALNDPRALLPPGEAGTASRLSILAGQCGGCGAEVTAEDVERFVDQWMGNASYAEMLTSARFGRLAFALAADGTGRKVAVAVLLGDR